MVPSITQVLPTDKIKLVGAFCERPRANAVRPYGKKDRERKILCPFYTPCRSGWCVTAFRCTIGR